MTPARLEQIGALENDHAGRISATAFGLDIVADVPLPFMAGACNVATGRSFEVVCRSSDVAALNWPNDAELLSNEVDPDGSVHFRIEAHPQRGYLIAGPKYGAFLMSGDGREVICSAGSGGDSAWQRLLIAQVLPFAAVLNGLEVLHASAVVLEGRALAFVGSSGTGKTSLAVELCAKGAEFLADDVLVVERHAEMVIGHPGSPLVGIEEAQVDASSSLPGCSTRTPCRAKQMREMQGAAGPAPVEALFFLDRRPDGPPEPVFVPVRSAGALLTATFNFVLDSPQRLGRLLDVSALLAQRRIEKVSVGTAVAVAQLADAVMRRLEDVA